MRIKEQETRLNLHEHDDDDEKIAKKKPKIRHTGFDLLVDPAFDTGWEHFVSPRTLQSVRRHSAMVYDGHYQWRVVNVSSDSSPIKLNHD